jgi:hypothetical protein
MPTTISTGVRKGDDDQAQSVQSHEPQLAGLQLHAVQFCPLASRTFQASAHLSYRDIDYAGESIASRTDVLFCRELFDCVPRLFHLVALSLATSGQGKEHNSQDSESE